jgi:protein-tyrosine phosphatase
LFHCSQGKDRTGIAAILIFLALGVPEKQIISDYMLTNEHRQVFIDKKMNTFKIASRLSSNVSQAILAVEGVIPESIHMLLAEILERYDSYEEFLYQEYDLTQDDLDYLRDLYLEGDKIEL